MYHLNNAGKEGFRCIPRPVTPTPNPTPSPTHMPFIACPMGFTTLINTDYPHYDIKCGEKLTLEEAAEKCRGLDECLGFSVLTEPNPLLERGGAVLNLAWCLKKQLNRKRIRSDHAFCVKKDDPTPSPTASPTDTPTASPTAPPTASPTDPPTPGPTQSPTASPTPPPTPAKLGLNGKCRPLGNDVATRDAACEGDLVCARKGHDGRDFGGCWSWFGWYFAGWPHWHHCCSAVPSADEPASAESRRRMEGENAILALLSSVESTEAFCDFAVGQSICDLPCSEVDATIGEFLPEGLLDVCSGTGITISDVCGAECRAAVA